MNIFVLLVFITASSATFHKLTPNKLYKTLLEPFVDVAVKGIVTSTIIEPIGHFISGGSKKSKHHKRKYRRYPASPYYHQHPHHHSTIAHPYPQAIHPHPHAEHPYPFVAHPYHQERDILIHHGGHLFYPAHENGYYHPCGLQSGLHRHPEEEEHLEEPFHHGVGEPLHHAGFHYNDVHHHLEYH